MPDESVIWRRPQLRRVHTPPFRTFRAHPASGLQVRATHLGNTRGRGSATPACGRSGRCVTWHLGCAIWSVTRRLKRVAPAQRRSSCRSRDGLGRVSGKRL